MNLIIYSISYMSGSSYEGAPCPICGENMSSYNDWKPYDMVSGDCYNCGFYYHTVEGRDSLDGLNDMRESNGELPEVGFNHYNKYNLDFKARGIADSTEVAKD